MTPYNCLTLIYHYYYSCYTFMKGSAKTFGCEKNSFSIQIWQHRGKELLDPAEKILC